MSEIRCERCWVALERCECWKADLTPYEREVLQEAAVVKYLTKLDRQAFEARERERLRVAGPRRWALPGNQRARRKSCDASSLRQVS